MSDYYISCLNCQGPSCEECGGSGHIPIGESVGVERSGKRWTPLEDRILEHLFKDMTYRRLAEVLGRAEPSVRNRCYEKGLRKQVDDWTPDEVHRLFSWYVEHDTGRGDLKLDEISIILGRHKTNVCRKARELGLTDQTRPFGDLLLKYYREQWKEMWKRNPHPRGMLGKKHTEESKMAMGIGQKARAAKATKKEYADRGRKMVATNLERYGVRSPSVFSTNTYSRCKRGYRDDLPGIHFRSAWEANYARWLNLLVSKGKILKWEYEVDTFIFHGETRGAMSYLPDFKVWNLDGEFSYHEVKGWMDSKSKTKLKRMKKHYPQFKVVVIGEKEYKSISEYSALIPNWEYPD